MATTGIFVRLALPILAHICLGLEARSWMQMGSSGELIKVATDDQPVKALLNAKAKADQEAQATHQGVANCHTDYVLGPPLSNDCNDAETDSFIASETECQDAAKRANVEYVKNWAPDPVTDQHPLKCFMMNCAGSATKPCMYWNRLGVAGGDGTVTRGRKVCKRSRIAYGTAGTNPSTGCPAGYKAIKARLLCEETISCMPEVTLAAPIKTSLNHMDYYHHHPQYCYIAKDGASNKIFFNPPVGPYTAESEPDDPGCANKNAADGEAGYCGNLPQGGSPICKPANILFFLPSTPTDEPDGSNGVWPAMYGLSDDENATTNSANSEERYGRVETDECLMKKATNPTAGDGVCTANELSGVDQALYTTASTS